MNQGVYHIANTIEPVDTEYQTSEFFDVYSPPIRSQYSQVIWTLMDTVRLPQHIIQRFENQTMAIMGYEVDQVKINEENGQEEPVPITHAYNHHFMAWLRNSRTTKFVQKNMTVDMINRGMSHGSHQTYWTSELTTKRSNNQQDDSANRIYSQVFSEGNGGEFRLSYHGYPPGYGQLIHGPDTFQITPMQIDTWNRDERTPKYKAGPLPRNSPRYNDSLAATYSALLECPCSDRIHKTQQQTYRLIEKKKKEEGLTKDSDDNDSSACEEYGRISNATECFQSAQQLVPAASIHSREISEKDGPPGCSLMQQANGTLQVTWNDEDTARLRRQQKQQSPSVVAFASGQINATVVLRPTDNTSLITMVGPADAWFGIGFGSHSMCLANVQGDECPDGGPYAIVVLGDQVQERKLDFHGPGIELSSSLVVQSNTIQGNNRTVVMTRPFQVPDTNNNDRYYTFTATDRHVPIIMARGCSLTFAQHCGHGGSDLNFVPMDEPLAVCRGPVEWFLNGQTFPSWRCPPPPASDLGHQKNPTCHVETYQGGLKCCRHKQYLLDHDQEIPWADQVLEYRLKFRFYFQEYREQEEQQGVNISPEDEFSRQRSTAPSHRNLVRLYRQTEANAGEYDIQPCPAETPPSQCVQVITSQWKVRDLLNDCPLSDFCTGVNSSKADGIQLIYAGPHCHAPSCLSMELYNADTGELLCRVEPVIGQSTDTVYDEAGFLAMPPCLWGDQKDGFLEPIFLPTNTTLLSIKRNNNTFAHTGEMASWQMRGVIVMDQSASSKTFPEDMQEQQEDIA